MLMRVKNPLRTKWVISITSWFTQQQNGNFTIFSFISDSQSVAFGSYLQGLLAAIRLASLGLLGCTKMWFVTSSGLDGSEFEVAASNDLSG